jgi:hypothetical protein
VTSNVTHIQKDRALVGRRRGEHMKAGFALQLLTVRWLGTFLEDPLDVPGAVLDFVAWQLGVADPSPVKQYTERTKTRFDHQWEIRRVYRLREFADAEAEFAGWVAAGHEPEPGGVVMDGHPALAGPARRPGRGGAGGHVTGPGSYLGHRPNIGHRPNSSCA